MTAIRRDRTPKSPRAPSRPIPAPLWNWDDKAVACLCAPHAPILTSAETRFLWYLSRRRQSPLADMSARLDRIVDMLDRYAVDSGIIWP
jgi:hypothetical protein